MTTVSNSPQDLLLGSVKRFVHRYQASRLTDSVENDLARSGSSRSKCIWWVGLSGGMDSVVLLEILSQLSQSYPDVELRALHVHHGLSPCADDWVEHCSQQCRQRQIPLIVEKITVSEQTQLGLENKARMARWAVYSQYVKENDALWLAHHQDDQCETLLLNLLRGTGVIGACGIRECSDHHSMTVLRPLLGISKQSLLAWATKYQLEWIDDESNQSYEHSRNFLRHRIFPQLASRWKGYRETLSRFTHTMQQTEGLLASLAEQDWQAMHSDALQRNHAIPAFEPAQSFDCRRFMQLSPDRQANLLRFWLSSQVSYLPSFAQLNEFCVQINGSRLDQNIEMRWGSYCVHQTANKLVFGSRPSSQPVEFNQIWTDLLQPLWLEELELSLVCLRIGSVSERSEVLKEAESVPLEKCKTSDKTEGYDELAVRPPEPNEVVRVLSRQGGEKATPHFRQHSASLKKIYQEIGLNPERRQQIPLIFYNQRLVAAVGVFYDRTFLVKAGNRSEGIVFQLSRNDP